MTCFLNKGIATNQPTFIFILYPLKTLENQRFSGVCRGYKMGTLARIGLITPEILRYPLDV